MKVIVSLFALLTSCSFLFAQNKDVEVYEKKDGNKVLIIARNTGAVEYKVKITITSEGMDVTPGPVVEASVPGGYMKEMATLTPRPGEVWSYGYDVSIIASVAKTVTKTPATTTTQPDQAATIQTDARPAAQPSLSDAKVILYAKPGCGRCTFAKKQLNSLGIEYLEVNTQSTSPEVSHMWSQLRQQGFTGGSVTMPVIRIDGKYHYDIKDIEGLINGIKG